MCAAAVLFPLQNKDSVVVLEDDSSRLTSHGVQAGSALTLVLAH